MKTNKIFRMIATLLFAAMSMSLIGCPTPFNNLNDRVNHQNERNDEQDRHIADLQQDVQDIQNELNSIQAWMIVTDSQLLSAFQLISDNAASITQLRQDMEDGDQNLQDQLDDLLDLFWDKYDEVSDRIDDVIFQQNQDRQQFQQGLMMAMTGIAITNWRVTQLENAFQNAASNFQNQLNDLRDDLNDLETALRAEIQDLATDIAANADEIADLWMDVAYIFANYYTAAQVDTMLDLIDDEIVAVRNRLDDVEADLATKITLLEAEQETYRILFGDNAVNPDGSLKPYFANQMYWNNNFQGFSRVVNSIFYQVASAINNPGHTPPLHVAQSLANALLNYFATANDLNLLEGEVAGLQSNLEALIESLGDQYRWRGSGSLAERDALTNVEVNDVWVFVDTWLGAIVQDVQLLRYDGYAWVPIVGGSIFIDERVVNGDWHSWDISTGTDFASDGFTLSGSVFFSGFSSSMEMDKIYVQIRDESSNLFGAKFLANGQPSQWKAEIGENLGSGPKVGTQSALWTAGVAAPFELTYNGSVLRLFVNSVEVLTYPVAGLSGGDVMRVTVVERTAGLEVELRDVNLDGITLGTFNQ